MATATKSKVESPKSKASVTAARLKVAYNTTYAAELLKDLGLKNVHEVPKLEKITLNIGLGKAKDDKKVLEVAMNTLKKITGQQPVATVAKNSIASFKLREGNKIGLKVTLRGDRMYEFMDRLINIALPRVRDFRGISPKSFDGRGNYTLGLKDQLIFPEIDFNKIEKTKGMNICFTTTAVNDEEGMALLKHLGMPFRQ